jgi:glycine/sarcosine N-methyltransferase
VSSNTFLSPEIFYDKLSAEYDSLTDFKKRFSKDLDTFRNLIERFGISSAVDAGAGTGFHALLLAKLGISVTAVDISGEMLEKCRFNAQTLGVSVKTVQSDFAHIHTSVAQTFDSVFCLGNSLAHVISESDLYDSLTALKKILNPGGILVLQILNYEKILGDRNRIQNIRNTGEKTYIRFYDYCADRIFFNILTLHNGGSSPSHTLQTVELRPYVKDELLPSLRKVGFGEIQAYGDLRFGEYSNIDSKDLVIIARTYS